MLGLNALWGRSCPGACPTLCPLRPCRPQAVCGRGDVEGDGVTPLCISQLPGAEPLVLPGVWHLPRRAAGQLWYGDSAVIDQWQPYLLDPAGLASGSGSGAQQAGSARGGVAA